MACLLAVASVTLQVEAFNFLDSVALYEQVFAIEGKSLKPSETKRLLEDLRASYYGVSDSGSQSISSAVNSLLDACDTSISAKCYQGAFLKLDSLLRANAQFSVNVIPYLQYCKNEMFLKCKQYFDGELRENVKHLDDVDRDSIKSLVNVVSDEVSKLDGSVKLELTTFKIPSVILKRAVTKFLEENKNLVDVNQSTGLNQGEKCKRSIGTVCNVAVDQIGRSVQHYEQHFITDRDFVKQLNPFEETWIINVRVCRLISQDLNVLCDSNTAIN